MQLLQQRVVDAAVLLAQQVLKPESAYAKAATTTITALLKIQNKPVHVVREMQRLCQENSKLMPFLSYFCELALCFYLVDETVPEEFFDTLEWEAAEDFLHELNPAMNGFYQGLALYLLECLEIQAHPNILDFVDNFLLGEEEVSEQDIDPIVPVYDQAELIESLDPTDALQMAAKSDFPELVLFFNEQFESPSACLQASRQLSSEKHSLLTPVLASLLALRYGRDVLTIYE